MKDLGLGQPGLGELVEDGPDSAASTAIGSVITSQAAKATFTVSADPALNRARRDTNRPSCRRQGDPVFKVKLQKAEPFKRAVTSVVIEFRELSRHGFPLASQSTRSTNLTFYRAESLSYNCSAGGRRPAGV
jgi:hypothetical protein